MSVSSISRCFAKIEDMLPKTWMSACEGKHVVFVWPNIAAGWVHNSLVVHVWCSRPTEPVSRLFVACTLRSWLSTWTEGRKEASGVWPSASPEQTQQMWQWVGNKSWAAGEAAGRQLAQWPLVTCASEGCLDSVQWQASGLWQVYRDAFVGEYFSIVLLMVIGILI
jgi:hypothetical protein